MTHEHDDETLIGQLHDEVQAETTEVAVAAGKVGAEAASRRWIPWTVAGCLLVSILTAAATAVGIGHLGSQVEGLGTSVSEVRRLAQEAKTSGDAANAQLAQRGQAPVPIPQPGQAQDSDVLVAAATAKVLALLPDNRPTTDQIVDAVAVYMAANGSRFAPSPQQINESVADYLAKNPAPSGPPGVPGADGKAGKDGVDGHTPTEQEIQDAWAAFIRDHPDALCPKGGSFAQLRVQLADGGTADMWTCVVQVTPPSTTQSSAVPLLPLGR